jgi:hypothetical protein
MSEVRISRSAVMRFVFPAAGLVFIALLFANVFSVAVQYQRIRSALSSTPDITSPPVMAPAVETQSAVEAEAVPEIPAAVETVAQAAPEVLAKVEPAAKSSREVLAKVGPPVRAARAEAPPKNRRVTRSRGYKQTPSFATFSIKGY